MKRAADIAHKTVASFLGLSTLACGAWFTANVFKGFAYHLQVAEESKHSNDSK